MTGRKSARQAAKAILAVVLAGTVPQTFAQQPAAAPDSAKTGVEESIVLSESEEPIDVANRLLQTVKEAKGRKISLSLRQCVTMAIENNYGIKIQQISPMQAAEALIKQQAVFDPTVTSGDQDGNGGLLAVTTNRQASTTRGGNDTYTLGATGGLGVNFPTYTGGVFRVGYDMGYNESSTLSNVTSYEPYYTAAAFMAITHPLLRGAGLDYNLAGIRIAKNNRDISDEQFRQQSIQSVFDTESAYWNLVRAIEDLRVSVKSLQVSVDNRQSSYLQYKAGTQPELEVTTADAGVAVRLSSVISAESTVRDREDQLKNIINLPDDWRLKDLHIVPLDQPVERIEDISPELDLSKALSIALKCRPELHQLDIERRSLEIAVRQRTNELMPTLNMTASLAYQGLDGGFTEAPSRIGINPRNSSTAGVTFSYPLGNRSAKAGVRSAILDLRRSKLSREQTEQNIVVAVRSAIRRIRTDEQRVKATRKAQELQGKRLEAEQRKKEVGRSTSYMVLDVEKDVVAAQRDYVNALIDYHISLANLEKELGTLLDVRGISIEPSSDRPASLTMSPSK